MLREQRNICRPFTQSRQANIYHVQPKEQIFAKGFLCDRFLKIFVGGGSSVLGGQVVAEIVWNGTSWQWNRGYVYLGSQLLAVQQGGLTGSMKIR